MEYRIQVRIDQETVKGRFQDAIYFAPDDFAKFTESELEAMVQARVDAFVASFPEIPVEPVEPLKEDLEKDKANIEALKLALDEQIRQLDVKIQEKEGEVVEPIVPIEPVEDNIVP